ncbi:MAG TPA: C39 family peptidase [Candidatus Angelobacter sp.]|nr:C39 family peptidase [Candidatus Angelobacter sp.]
MNRVPRRLSLMLGLCGTLCLAQDPGVWIDVPFFKQEKNGCGAASIAMVMQYWQAAQTRSAQPASSAPTATVQTATIDPETIQRELYSAKDHGVRASDMQRYFQDHGFRTFAFRGTWEDLKLHLEKGRPLIVALKPLPAESALHYVVVVGLDWNQNVVIVNDAAQRKLLKEDRGAFEKEWSAVDRWTLLAVPRSQE